MRMFGVLVVLALVAGACAGDSHDPVHDLEERLMAPCCWRQTLADHDSPTATAMRAEIREQVAAGVTPDAIERRFVERYGPQIRALGTGGGDPRWIIGVAVGAAAVAGLALLLVIVRRRRPRPVAAPPPVVEDERYADRLDDELAYVD